MEDSKRTSQVVAEVLQRALASDNGLNEESEHGEHSQAAVLDLLDLELSEGIRVVSQAQGVKGLTRVEGVETLTSGAAVDTVTLHETHEDHEDGNSGTNRLGVDQSRVAEVVETILIEDRGLDLEPFRVSAEVDGARALELLRDEAADGAKHSPASVDHLSLTVASEGLGIGRETSGIPAVVTRVFTSQIRRGDGEGTCTDKFMGMRYQLAASKQTKLPETDFDKHLFSIRN